MCFGNQTTSTQTNSSAANPAVAAAATSNLGTAQNTLNNSTAGQEYQGPLTAAISPNQQGTIDAATGIANNGTGATAQGLINNYAGAPAQNVSTNTIASQMSPYMNQYVMNALAPQLQQMDMSNAATNAATNAQATGSGAFGDARAGIQASNDAFNQNVQREGVIGNAYNSAFNTAIGAGAQDVANQNSTQLANANFNETALNRSLGGATADQALQTQQLGAQTTANSLTQQDTAQSQADLTAQYNNWLQAQQSQIAAQGSANQTVAAGAAAMPATTTGVTTAPDNSGYALLGSAIGTAGKLALSDRRAKKDIAKIGELNDGSNVYSFVYKGDPNQRQHIGLMAQEVRKRTPSAVHKLPSGYMAVDYGAATALARAMGA
jgi:hypothetical protein